MTRENTIVGVILGWLFRGCFGSKKFKAEKKKKASALLLRGVWMEDSCLLPSANPNTYYILLKGGIDGMEEAFLHSLLGHEIVMEK